MIFGTDQSVPECNRMDLLKIKPRNKIGNDVPINANGVLSKPICYSQVRNPRIRQLAPIHAIT